MLKVKLTNFRCFADPKPVELRPITFLVGENSTGKTSFLAAVRQLLESFKRSPQGNPFNRDPYFLGGYDQIAHYRGGRFGRAKSFTISVTIPTPREGIPVIHPRAASIPGVLPASHSFTFTKGTPQPELAGYEFRSRGQAARLILTGDKPKVEFDGLETPKLYLGPRGIPPLDLLRSDLSYLRYVFDDMYFRRPTKEGVADGEPRRLAIFSAYRHTSQILGQMVFASAPVRTEPQRVYTPSELVASSEGAHVPLEMAKQKALSPDKWRKVRHDLAAFGTNAGLFDDIDIRLLGKHDGDPFQIQVRMGGPAVNLVDVGYGVSQALPIIYQLQNSAQYKVFLLQQPEVHLHPRAQAELGTLFTQLAEQRKHTLYVIETHSDYILDRVRIEVMRKKIDPRMITIVYFDRTDREVEPYNILNCTPVVRQGN